MSYHNLRKLLPSVYNGVDEMEEIIRIEQGLMETNHDAGTDLFDCTFVNTATEANGGLKWWEDLIGIKPLDTDTEETRRTRIVVRWNRKPPYTLIYLHQQFDKIIGKGYVREDHEHCTGEGAYELWIDYNNYTMYLETETMDQLQWCDEVGFTCNCVLPCNIVFCQRNNIVQGMGLTEKTYILSIYEQWNYSLDYDNPDPLKVWKLYGTFADGFTPKPFFSTNDSDYYHYSLGYWKFGAVDPKNELYPFANLDGGELVKMATKSSIGMDYITKQADNAVSLIHHVVINEGLSDQVTVTTFDDKARYNEYVNLMYTIKKSQTTLIQSIKIYSADNKLLSHCTVAMPVLLRCQVRHRIKIRELLRDWIDEE